MKFIAFIRDVRNLFFIIFKIRKMRKTSEWKKLNIRHDWIYRAYTVINMQKEDFMDAPESLEYKFITACKPIFTLFEENGMGEVIVPQKVLIEGSYSYLLYFKHRLMVFSFWYIFSRSIFLTVLYFLTKFLINFVGSLNGI